MIVYGETGPESNLTKWSLNVKEQISNWLSGKSEESEDASDSDPNDDPANNTDSDNPANVTIGDLNDSSIQVGAFYDPETFVSQHFIQLSLNLTQNALSTLKGKLKKTQLRDLDDSTLNIPAQDFKGQVLEPKLDILEKEYVVEFYNSNTSQVFQVKSYRLTLVCPSEMEYSLDNVKALINNETGSNSIANHSFSMSGVKIFSQPCTATKIYIFQLPLIALNDYDQTVPNDEAGFTSAIRDRFNQLINNDSMYVYSVQVNYFPLNGTYDMTNVTIRDCVEIVLNVRSIVNTFDNPLAPLLAKMPLPPSALNNLIIPTQTYDGFRTKFMVDIVQETFSFHLAGLGLGAMVIGNYGDALNLTAQLSNILRLPFSCFQDSLFVRDKECTQFHINVTSVCGDRMVDIVEANSTFLRLLNGGNLILKGVNGEKYLAQPLAERKILIEFIILTDLKTNENDLESFLTLHVPKLMISDESYTQLYRGELVNGVTNIATRILRVVFLAEMNCSYAAKIKVLDSTTLGIVNGSQMAIPKQTIDAGILRKCPFSSNIKLQYSVSPTVAIQPVLGKLKERARFNLSTKFDYTTKDDVLATLQNQTYNNFSGILNNSVTDIEDGEETQYQLQIDWYNLSVLVEPASALRGFSGVTSKSDFLTVAMQKYLDWHKIPQNQILPGTNASGVAYAGMYNGKMNTNMLTDVIQVSFAVANIVTLGAQNRDTHGGYTFEYNNETLLVPLQYANGSAVKATHIRTIEILIAYDFKMLVANNERGFVEMFKRQVSTWTNISSEFFMNYTMGPFGEKDTAFRLNATAQYRNKTIDLEALYSNFTIKLDTNKMAIKDDTGYPIHILPLKVNNFIIIRYYDETKLKSVPAIAATVILIVTVAYIDIIEFRIKRWYKKREAKRNAITPALNHHLDSKESGQAVNSSDVDGHFALGRAFYQLDCIANSLDSDSQFLALKRFAEIVALALVKSHNSHQ